MSKVAIVLGLVLALSGPVYAAEPGERKPNVLLIISDDQGYGDFGLTGAESWSAPFSFISLRLKP